MSATLRLLVTTPLGEHVVEDVVYLRLDGPDGYRGVQPGRLMILSATRVGCLRLCGVVDGVSIEFAFAC